MRPKLRKIPDEALLQYIKLDTSTLGVLRIDFDGLCQYLIQVEHRNFLVAEFEKTLQNELDTRLKGKQVSIDALKAVCKYVDDLSKYMTAKKLKDQQGPLPQDTKNKFFSKHKDYYEEVLKRVQHRSPEEYKILKRRFDKRFGSDARGN